MDGRASSSVARVLIVDDEVDLLGVLAGELSDAGYQVTAVDNGRAAVEAAIASRFDVAITDLRMPEMDGCETTARLKRIDPRLPIIVATGYVSEDARLEAAGAY